MDREAYCLRNGRLERCVDRVVVERAYAVYVNGSRLVSLSCSPGMEEELALGFLAGLGFSPSRGYSVSVEGGRVEVRGELERAPWRRGWGKFPAEVVVRAVERLAELGEGFRATGALHGALCFTPGGEVVGFVEDVSRHCAVDKCLGLAVKRGLDLGSLGFAVTCRLTGSVVEKFVSASVPLVASKAAVTLQGVLAAERGGVTLVGFARGGRFNVYTYPKRIALS
ncbi:formate dehydrogenase family accessory protein FdhD [Thermofilum pendens Hrk 5]|uniref:Formate dehydrogenase family accessory protein FdhD n=1 Tax=Thermofilum pendens (strain DSM 2475 / Hrk 5) TaxID=368408 RepID=A1RZM6_THEPD|nr:formate dehydrogenase family accessory protein FdhD [Thermofilum pendens Hrk 5]